MSQHIVQHADLIRRNHCRTGKTVLATAITLVLGGVTATVSAALPLGTTLSFEPGTPFVSGCGFGTINPTTGTCTFNGTPTGTELTDMGGSYFGMDVDDSGQAEPIEKVSIVQFEPIVFGNTQVAAGAHPGAPDGSESPAVDEAWLFAGNTGMHSILSPISVSSDLGITQMLDFAGWAVIWSGFDENNPITMPGTATLVCETVACADGESYTLDMDVHVPAAFTSTGYTVHLEGNISLPGQPPVTNPDSGTTIIGNPVVIDVLANDSSADGLDPASVTVVVPPADGTTDDTNPDGTITYTPRTGPDFVGVDAFDYTVDSVPGITSAATTVDVGVQANVAPVAGDDLLEVGTAVLDTAPQVVVVLDNDSDANNAPGLPGGIDPASVVIVDQAATGTCTANANGTITYSQIAPSVGGSFSCTYRVSDVDVLNAPLASNLATLSINVTATQSDWPLALDSDIIPVLFYNPGTPGDPTDRSVPPAEDSGSSYFTMQVTPTTLIYTVVQPGPSAAIIINHDQPASGTHTGFPNGTEEPSIDEPWDFFGNTGLMFTKNGSIVGNPDGTLKFSGEPGINDGQGRYLITWNGIPEIDLGGDPDNFPADLGFGAILCDPAPCEDQSTYVLEYETHVPVGDPSGFGGVPFGLHFEGTVGFLDRKLKTSTGTITSESRLLASEVTASDPDDEVSLQCVGDCFDYTIENMTANRASVVIPLAGGVPLNPVWRILDNGIWRSFDTTVDIIKSASFSPGDTECPEPGDLAYAAPPSEGDYCIELTITDNGPNDLDPAVNTISDPSGMGSGGSAGGGTEFVDTRTSNTSQGWGCSIMADSVNPLQRSDWWLLGGFMAWFGWNRKNS